MTWLLFASLGLRKCYWPGRSHIIERGDVTFYLDGAHTPDSIQVDSEDNLLQGEGRVATHPESHPGRQCERFVVRKESTIQVDSEDNLLYGKRVPLR